MERDRVVMCGVHDLRAAPSGPLHRAPPRLQQRQWIPPRGGISRQDGGEEGEGDGGGETEEEGAPGEDKGGLDVAEDDSGGDSHAAPGGD